MKKAFLLLVSFSIALFGEIKVSDHDSYLSTITYEERKNMKIKSVELALMLEEGTAQLVDIIFK